MFGQEKEYLQHRLHFMQFLVVAPCLVLQQMLLYLPSVLRHLDFVSFVVVQQTLTHNTN